MDRVSRETTLQKVELFRIIYFLVSIVIVPVLFKTGGPWNEWASLNLDGTTVFVLMAAMWLFLLGGIVSKSPAVGFFLITCWLVLASLMPTFHQAYPFSNLSGALATLACLVAINRLRKPKPHGRPSDALED
jgi:hypothetical protein